MKALLICLVSLSLLIGCSPAERPTEDSAQADAGNASSGGENQPDGYNEYLWCQNGDNYSQEAYDSLMSDWTKTVVDLGFPELSYSIATPAGWSSNDFDHVAVLRWPSKDVREAGWKAYIEAGAQSNLDAEHPGVTVCGGEGNQQHLWGFNRYDGQAESASWDQEINPQARVGYSFCSYNANKAVSDLLEVVRGPFAEYLVSYEEKTGGSSYSYSYLAPDFEPSTADRSEGVPQDYDFTWMNFYADPAEQVASDSAWQTNGQSVQAAFDAVATCSDEQLHDLTQIKAPGV